MDFCVCRYEEQREKLVAIIHRTDNFADGSCRKLVGGAEGQEGICGQEIGGKQDIPFQCKVKPTKIEPL